MLDKNNTPVIVSDEIFKGIRECVNIECPSNDTESVNRQVNTVKEGAAKIGAVIKRIPSSDGFGDILKVRTPWGGDGPGIFMLSHLNTLNPQDTLDNQNPYRREGDKVFGPGIMI